MTKEEKAKIIAEYKISDNDTGSAQLQIAIISARIKELTEHLKENKKDFSSKRGLFKMISRRKRFFKYLKREDEKACKELKERLGLRK